MTYTDVDRALVRQKIIDNTIQTIEARWSRLGTPLEFSIIDHRWKVLLRRHFPTDLMCDIISQLHETKQLFLLITTREKILLLPATMHQLPFETTEHLQTIEDHFHTTKLRGSLSPKIKEDLHNYKTALGEIAIALSLHNQDEKEQ